MCEECLSTNRQGDPYCRSEDDCLAHQDEPSSPDEPTSPILGYLVDGSSLEALVERISRVLGELEELEELFEELGGKGLPDESSPGPSGPALPREADQRIAGFCACRLAEEADALMRLLSLRVDFLRKGGDPAGSPDLFQRANEVKGFLKHEAEPKIRGHMDWAGPFGNLDAEEILAGVEP